MLGNKISLSHSPHTKIQIRNSAVRSHRSGAQQFSFNVFNHTCNAPSRSTAASHHAPWTLQLQVGGDLPKRFPGHQQLLGSPSNHQQHKTPWRLRLNTPAALPCPALCCRPATPSLWPHPQACGVSGERLFLWWQASKQLSHAQRRLQHQGGHCSGAGC